MSHTAKETEMTAPNPGTLSPDVDTLTSEFKKLDSILASINSNIQTENEKIVVAQQAIADNRAQGLQVVGQANVVARILMDMGIDAKTLTTPPPVVTGETTPAPFVDAIPEPEEDVPAKPSLRNRFSSR